MCPGAPTRVLHDHHTQAKFSLPCQHLTNLLFLHLKKYKSCLLWPLLWAPFWETSHALKLLFSSTNLFCINLITLPKELKKGKGVNCPSPATANRYRTSSLHVMSWGWWNSSSSNLITSTLVIALVEMEKVQLLFLHTSKVFHFWGSIQQESWNM